MSLPDSHGPRLSSDPIGRWPNGSENVPGFFDRFYFNLHGATPHPFVMVGAGFHPHAGVTDGYVLAVVDGEQRNLRFSEPYTGATSAGPLRWEVIEPHQEWLLALADNEIGVGFELTWRARSAFWETEPVVLDNSSSGITRFEHGFQSGRYVGDLRIDGQSTAVDGWFGQRDRSQGVRPMSGGQGLHLWVQAQMPDHTISLMLDVDRDHRPTLLDGAVLPEGGAGERIVAVEHDLVFNDDLDFVRGTLSVRTASGDTLDLGVDGAAGGGFLAGGGYGGWHGKPRGTVTESERWSLDGSMNPRRLDTPLTDRPAVFHSGSQVGTGVFEFAHTRSPCFTYRPARVHRADVHAVGR